MSLKVNGKAYDWGDVDIKLPGLALQVQEISYDDEQEMEETYGKGSKPRGFGTGNYKASGKMSLLRDDYDDLLAYYELQEGEQLIDTAPPNMRPYAGAVGFVSPKWDSDTSAWMEGATEDEISSWESEHPAPETATLQPSDTEVLNTLLGVTEQ